MPAKGGERPLTVNGFFAYELSSLAAIPGPGERQRPRVETVEFTEWNGDGIFDWEIRAHSDT
jgi:hypothetical protein